MQVLVRWLQVKTLLAVFMSGLVAFSSVQAIADPKAETFKLANGLQAIVIPDHRVPIVTHMIFYRVGAADAPMGKSGAAHFLEHLMYKSTNKMKTGEFTQIINRFGGRHNALTTQDTTAFFQRIAKDHLQTVMALESDRMVNLQMKQEEVRTERDVVKEERRSSVDAVPVALLNEQMLAILYENHPYGKPVLGWDHEIDGLTLKDEHDFYDCHYGPNNSVLVVAGDVTVDDVRKLAEATYGMNAPNASVRPRSRPSEPEPIAPRWVQLEDARAGTPLMLRYYHVPSYKSSSVPGEAEALVLLARILGGDDTSRLYRALVLQNKIALQAGADYQGNGLDSGRLSIVALAGRDVASERLEATVDEVVSNFLAGDISDDELSRAKLALEVERIFEADNQEALARRYGEAVAVGRAVADVDAIASRIDAVTVADIKRVAGQYLISRRSVTGSLVRPMDATAAAGRDASQPKH